MGEPVVGVVGAGRLGSAVARRCEADGLAVRALDSRRPERWRLGAPPDVVVDCSAPQVTVPVLDLCEDLGVPLVECVSDADAAVLEERARRTPVVRATNLALGNFLQHRVVDLLADLVLALERAGAAGAVPEAAVLERHPATKAHRPSATADALGRRWEARSGRPPSDVASLRAGPPVSDHEVRLTWAGQGLVVRHEVRSLDAAATGAVALARWVVGRAPGLYPAHAAYEELVRAARGGRA
ncbi:dihydrodipicolinate reductase C-terminal domain-containing protein [Saccharothrix syringae]|uniref:4-hydroxy-tetrahydrodipicolinate reductase n=1 Tax=Saccharothrix syringae TaxID=103733 RepID=A0A5Q0H098_SACSY|nr:dihydrodipicolinate reductase C-terminal domain-containing protein [Saccharothrix syringae]QFZ19609.1 hypothetical protein EKG83_21180 [Saccharothrix syringae]